MKNILVSWTRLGPCSILKVNILSQGTGPLTFIYIHLPHQICQTHKILPSFAKLTSYFWLYFFIEWKRNKNRNWFNSQFWCFSFSPVKKMRRKIYGLRNGILFPKLSWPNWEKWYCVTKFFSDLLWEKIVLVIVKNFWNSRLKADNFQKFWDHLNNLLKQWQVITIFGNRTLFKLVPWDFLDLIN